MTTHKESSFYTMNTFPKATILLLAFALPLYFPVYAKNANLKLGDNVLEYLKKNKPISQKYGPKISHWHEGQLEFLSYEKNAKSFKKPVIVQANNIPFAVLQKGSKDAYFLIDSNGDQTLDLKSNNIILPYWIVQSHSKNKKAANNIKTILDLLYNSFQSNKGPYFDKTYMPKAVAHLKSFETATQKPHRDLAYLIYFYNIYNQKLPSVSLQAITLLEQQYQQRFGTIHPLILLYKAETYINLGTINHANEYIKKLRSFDPTCIPAKAYEYRLEKNNFQKDELYKNLKKNHPNHWIVKQL